MLRRAGFSESMGVEAALLGKSERGRAYDRFRGRLMFPIRSLSGNVIAFGGRIIANEDEAKTFTCEAEPLNALQVISEMCELAVVKIGIKGAMIKHGDEVVHVGILAAAKRVDTTGAGDFYAAGFLAGLCENLSLRQCGTIGAIAAGRVIEVTGTTLADETWTEIDRLIRRVEAGGYLF